MSVIIATWEHSLAATNEGARVLKETGSTLEACVALCRYAEDDIAENWVGYGSWPNRDGVVQLDAGVMDGKTLNLGAVLAIEGFAHPADIARQILDDDLGIQVLAGEGAVKYAKQIGAATRDNLSDEMKERFLIDKPTGGFWEATGHDTVGTVAMDDTGNMHAAVSTSGLKYKPSGRVGDSPLVGSGFYVDNEAGGCVASGKGEDLMRFCISHYTVLLMKNGMAAPEAAHAAMEEMLNRFDRAGHEPGELAICCLDKNGGIGAATNHEKFCVCISRNGEKATTQKAVIVG